MATKKVDPRLYVPPVEDYEYEDALKSDVGVSSSTEEIVISLPGSGSSLQPPETITIVDQIVRKGSDGRTVVDLIVEVEDMPGATEYEVRTSQV